MGRLHISGGQAFGVCMIVLSLIDKSDKQKMTWKFDQILALLSFDIDIRVVFVGNGQKLLAEKYWNMIGLYSDNPMYILAGEPCDWEEGPDRRVVSKIELDELIELADIIL